MAGEDGVEVPGEHAGRVAREVIAAREDVVVRQEVRLVHQELEEPGVNEIQGMHRPRVRP